MTKQSNYMKCQIKTGIMFADEEMTVAVMLQLPAALR